MKYDPSFRDHILSPTDYSEILNENFNLIYMASFRKKNSKIPRRFLSARFNFTLHSGQKQQSFILDVRTLLVFYSEG